MLIRKIHKPGIALLVMVAFCFMLHLQAFPLHAQEQQANSPAAGSHVQEKPGVIEKLAPYDSREESSNLLGSIVIIALAVGVVALLIYLLIVKSYNIVGTWDFTFTGPITWTSKIRFSGDKTSGTWVFVDTPASTGMYTVDGDSLNMTWDKHIEYSFNGQFNSADTMSGAMITDIGWNWSATRSSSSAATPAQPTANSTFPLIKKKQ